MMSNNKWADKINLSSTEILEWMRQISLDEWLNLQFEEPEGVEFVEWMFPTDDHQAEYISRIDQFSEGDVIGLLRKFLIPSGYLGSDSRALEYLHEEYKNDPQSFNRKMQKPYYRRLWDLKQPWEGITWIEALLPHNPQRAIDALEAYLYAHIQQLPDGRMSGLGDAIAVIRAKFIGKPTTEAEGIKFLLGLKPREFERLIEQLYNRMGYDTELTPPEKDGGIDVIAKQTAPSKQEHLLIECKRYDKKSVGVTLLRQLLGVIAKRNFNKGVLITTSDFSRSARKEFASEPRIELISGTEIIPLLDKYLGLNWSINLSNIVLGVERNP
jgi:restriction system protein